ncbi:alpha- and gamma-adaptin-binding protein p34-like [Plodia interpunctella]|uniref:alpha- and gamma-adaptin-binding protein p34-like n=1 Tax=Plodia interpunctella TaxID=58824 RepID=UPI0023684635|nr:alpha- and gamma-adaptin-binding protein p34-like [Plodia interpunctella]XP_053621848.1 alpha- and gamma-adaptin-binding protein p34-like [Plodia interpunctella]XP_053621855.1 alpha- and gamma-adaptin-binding protein p34-like [Plodia interpunctella]XP_053621864.1 alpha- and gamma-adaptin-binding protein p34-like [Plodia interpunctella]
MGETDLNALPIILLSAKDNATASYMVSEIIDNDVTESYRTKEGNVVQDHVWRIVNKYYTADVRLRACGDEQLPIGDDPVDAHVIYLHADECSVSTCSTRSVPCAGVRLVLSAGEDDAVRRWCAAQRYELVRLAAAEDEADEDEADEWGVKRVRAALHAHAWPGLVRTDRPAPLDTGADSDGESSSAGAERFAAALAALPAAAAERPLRPPRAEALLAEFCRALGLDLDRC